MFSLYLFKYIYSNEAEYFVLITLHTSYVQSQKLITKRLNCLISGIWGQVTVTQNPEIKSIKQGETVTISCKTSQPISGCSNCVSWYQQKPGEAPKLLIYHINTLQSGTTNKYKFSSDELYLSHTQLYRV